MIYKLVVNAAFLAIGYYIGKQVGLGEAVRKQTNEPQQSSSNYASKEQSSQAARKQSSESSH